MTANELIEVLKKLVKIHGNLKLYREDDDCRAYKFSGARYDEREGEIRVF